MGISQIGGADAAHALYRDEGVAILCVTHAEALAARLGRTVRLADGALREDARQASSG